MYVEWTRVTHGVSAVPGPTGDGVHGQRSSALDPDQPDATSQGLLEVSHVLCESIPKLMVGDLNKVHLNLLTGMAN